MSICILSSISSACNERGIFESPLSLTRTESPAPVYLPRRPPATLISPPVRAVRARKIFPHDFPFLVFVFNLYLCKHTFWFKYGSLPFTRHQNNKHEQAFFFLNSDNIQASLSCCINIIISTSISKIYILTTVCIMTLHRPSSKLQAFQNT